MSHHRQLPVWKAAMDLAVHLEYAVRRFPCTHKYTRYRAEPHRLTGFKRRALVALWRPRAAAPVQLSLF